MKKVLLFFVSLFVGIALFVGVIRFVGWEEIGFSLRIFTGWQGLVIFCLSLLVLFFGMWKWKIILKSQGYDIPKRKLIAPYLAGFSLIYLFPMLILGGEIFRSYILKEKFNMPLRKGIVSVAIDKILEGTSFLVAIIVGTVFFLLKIGLPPKNLTILLGLVTLSLSALTGFFYFKSFKKQSIAKIFTKIAKKNRFLNGEVLEIEKEIFRFFRANKRAFWEGMGLAFVRVAVTWARCWLLIFFLGKTVGAFSALSILGFYYFVLFIPITAALGTHEVIQTFSFSALGIGAGLAPVFTMIQRAAEVAVALVGIVLFFRYGVGLIKTVLFRKMGGLLGKEE